MFKSVLASVLVVLLLSGAALAQSFSAWSSTSGTTCTTSGSYSIPDGATAGEAQVIAKIKVYNPSTGVLIYTQDLANQRWDCSGLTGLETTEFSFALHPEAPSGNCELEVRWNFDYTDGSGQHFLYDDDIVKTWTN